VAGLTDTDGTEVAAKAIEGVAMDVTTDGTEGVAILTGAATTLETGYDTEAADRDTLGPWITGAAAYVTGAGTETLEPLMTWATGYETDAAGTETLEPLMTGAAEYETGAADTETLEPLMTAGVYATEAAGTETLEPLITSAAGVAVAYATETPRVMSAYFTGAAVTTAG